MFSRKMTKAVGFHLQVTDRCCVSFAHPVCISYFITTSPYPFFREERTWETRLLMILCSQSKAMTFRWVTWVQISEKFKMNVEITAEIQKYSILASYNTELLEALSRLYRRQMLQVNTKYTLESA